MAHLHRFHVAPEAAASREIAIEGEEAHHAVRVARLRPGDRVALFDGQGHEFVGVVEIADKRAVCVAVEEERYEEQPATRLTLLQAWLNRDKPIEAIVEHCTEVGVDRFVFFRAAHSERAPAIVERWRRIAVEVCKQSGRLWLPRFDIAPTLEDALREPFDTLLAATRDLPPAPLRESIKGNNIALLVGPEGDFTRDELRLMTDRGAIPISLGPQTFRSEMAALVGATVIQYELQKVGPIS